MNSRVGFEPTAQNIQTRTNDNVEKEVHGCGFSWFSPLWMQRLAQFRVFMFFLCLNAVVQGAMVNGFISTSISSIEKRFNLTSTKSGIFSATYDVAVAFMLVPLSLLSGRVNKVRLIGIGMLFVGIGALILIVPQFTEGAYSVGQLQKDNCDPLRHKECTSQQSTSSMAYPVLLLSQIFLGLGAAPLFTYGYSTIDEFDAQKRTGVNMAFFMGAGTIGPALAFLGGGALLNIWGDTWKTDYKNLGISGPSDPRWYGAWWIGFLTFGIASFFTAIPLLFFPRKLNDTDERKKGDTTQTHKDLDKDFSDKKWELSHTYWLFLTSKMCMALVLMQTFESMVMNGYITFIPKLFENLFGVSSGVASQWTGMIVVPMGILGSYIGGKLVEFLNNNMRKMLWAALVLLFGMVLASCALLLKCPRIQIAGINTPYSRNSNGGVALIDQCNIGCSCDGLYNPVCATDSRISYFSPCHAACQVNADPSNPIWNQCGCTAGFNSTQLPVSKGWCTAECGLNKVFFFTLFALLALLIFISGPIIQNAALRVVSFNHRDQFICFGWLFMRVFGSIPGAILFGSIIDTTCLHWQENCDGSTKCLLYDSYELGNNIFYITVVTKLCCMICIMVAIHSYKSVHEVSTPTKEKEITNQDLVLEDANHNHSQ